MPLKTYPQYIRDRWKEFFRFCLQDVDDLKGIQFLRDHLRKSVKGVTIPWNTAPAIETEYAGYMPIPDYIEGPLQQAECRILDGLLAIYEKNPAGFQSYRKMYIALCRHRLANTARATDFVPPDPALFYQAMQDTGKDTAPASGNQNTAELKRTVPEKRDLVREYHSFTGGKGSKRNPIDVMKRFDEKYEMLREVRQYLERAYKEGYKKPAELGKRKDKFSWEAFYLVSKGCRDSRFKEFFRTRNIK